MAWPTNLDTVVINFPVDLLPYLKSAIENKRVKWVEGSQTYFAESFAVEFDYLGFRYLLSEQFEIVTSVTKIAKIDEDEEGNELIVEDYAFAQKCEQYGNWGEY